MATISKRKSKPLDFDGKPIQINKKIYYSTSDNSFGDFTIYEKCYVQYAPFESDPKIYGKGRWFVCVYTKEGNYLATKDASKLTTITKHANLLLIPSLRFHVDRAASALKNFKGTLDNLIVALGKMHDVLIDIQNQND